MNLAEQTTIVGMIKRSIRDIAGEQKDEDRILGIGKILREDKSADRRSKSPSAVDCASHPVHRRCGRAGSLAQKA